MPDDVIDGLWLAGYDWTGTAWVRGFERVDEDANLNELRYQLGLTQDAPIPAVATPVPHLPDGWADATALEDVVETQMPTTRGAISMSIDVFDDPTLAWYSSVQTASDAGTPYAFRIALKSGAKVVANAYWSLMDVPDIQRDQILTTNIALSFAAKPKRYAT
jgi:hypothetical protein